MLAKLLKDYGALVAVFIFLISYWVNSSLAEGSDRNQINTLVKNQASLELQVDSHTATLAEAVTVNSVQTEQLRTTIEVQKKQTEVLEDLAKTQQSLQVTLVGVQAELKASRLARDN